MQPVFANAVYIDREKEMAALERPGGEYVIEISNPKTGKMTFRSMPMKADNTLDALVSHLKFQVEYVLMEHIMKDADGYLVIFSGNQVVRSRPYVGRRKENSMSAVKSAGRNITVECPTGDPGELMLARVANTTLSGIRLRRDMREKLIGQPELDRPGLLIAPATWDKESMIANLYEAGNVRQCLEEMSGLEADSDERRYGNYYAFTLDGLNWKHLRHMSRRMPELFPAASFFCAGDILPGTDEADVCEAETALSCIELLAPFLQMPAAQQTAQA